MTTLDGKALAQKVKERVRQEAAGLPRRPGLAMVLVGEDPASHVYVRGKSRDCEQCGIYSETYDLPEKTTQTQLLALVEELNGREDIDGIIVELPLPAHLDERQVLEAVAPDKDVDCFHPFNAGKLFVGEKGFLPCTPAGIMELLEEYHIDPAGKRAVVVGRSNIVGKPVAMLLLKKDATVTICHSRTEGLAEICRQADILVAAVGKRGVLTADMVKEGAVVIDVSINRDAQGRLRGDVDYAAAAERAAYITPVPGGTGPVTRAVLMENTLAAALRHGKG